MDVGWVPNILPILSSTLTDHLTIFPRQLPSIAIVININMTIIDEYNYDYLFAYVRAVGSFFLVRGLSKNFDHHGWPTTKSFNTG